jgi:uncharacterized membrane protein YtjA (UPF0391 family)
LAWCCDLGEGKGDAQEGEAGMLQLAIVMLALSLVAGVLGFTGVMAASANVAQILFGVFLALFVIAAIASAWRRTHA